MKRKILISHRGNIDGRIPERENTVEYINEALQKGYNVEIDCHLVDREIFLGHDSGVEKMPNEFFINEKLWLHAKSLETFHFLRETIGSQVSKPNIFFHTIEDVVVTTNGYSWVNVHKDIGYNSILVLPEEYFYCSKKNINACVGICSDFISNYK
jgi:hypothetical protein